MGQTSLIGALGRYWWLVGVVLIGFVGLGFLLNTSQPVAYEATAELIVEDPRASRLFEVDDLGRPSTQSSERYLADQVQILRSAEVADVSSELLNGGFTPRYILLNSSVSGDLTSNLIKVSFRADTPEEAKAGADAIANGYQEVRRRQVQDTAAVALAKVDVLLAVIDSELEEIDGQIETIMAGDSSAQELNRQFAQAQAELNELRIRLDAETRQEERAVINERINELLRDFQVWEIVLRISERGSGLNALLAKQEAAVAERATLAARANLIEVDAELAAGGVTLYSPAPLPGQPIGWSLEVLLALAVVLGLALSTVVAYYLSLRRNITDEVTSGEAISFRRDR